MLSLAVFKQNWTWKETLPPRLWNWNCFDLLANVGRRADCCRVSSTQTLEQGLLGLQPQPPPPPSGTQGPRFFKDVCQTYIIPESVHDDFSQRPPLPHDRWCTADSNTGGGADMKIGDWQQAPAMEGGPTKEPPTVLGFCWRNPERHCCDFSALGGSFAAICRQFEAKFHISPAKRTGFFFHRLSEQMW